MSCEIKVQSRRRIKLPLSRRFIVDYLYFTKKVPSQPISRQCNLKHVATLRKQATQRIGWSAIMLKAAAILAESEPKLRCSFMKWPWPHLYLHPHQIAYLAASREVNDEPWLFFYRVDRPDKWSLIDLQEAIDEFHSQPVERNRLFRMRRMFSRLPWFVRRIIWWSALTLSGSLRTSLTGTLGITSVSHAGATSHNPPTLGNLVVTYGPVQRDGTVNITFVYDHRILDGGTIALALEKFETILNEEITAELLELSRNEPSLGTEAGSGLSQMQVGGKYSKPDRQKLNRPK